METLKGGNHMSHNYSKMFGNKNQQSSPSHEHEVNVVQQMTNQVENVDEPIVEEVKQEIVLVDGIVSNCELLNIRKESSKDAEVLCTIGVNTMVKVDLTVDKEAEEFYKIVTPNGVEGYCMKKFITIN
jgi:hypothetical protein